MTASILINVSETVKYPKNFLLMPFIHEMERKEKETRFENLPCYGIRLNLLM